MLAPASLPTSLRGSVDDSTYGAWLGDALECVPTLVYPASIAQYSAMRRDPTLAAILAGYELQIRRATWAVNGAGCRTEATQLVADDLGLQTTGHDEPGAARLRGVSWEDHLRAALLCLTYGHFAFELLASVQDGVAHLDMLSERMPNTINELHADPKTGVLLGITQDEMRKDGTPQIKADRLAFYSFQREGSAWQGTSLLRPAYAPHLLKQELQRILATSARRFGMGVPVVEWAAGYTPTPLQVQEAQQLASAARVGEQSGASLPPGASLKLVGLTGGTPETLSYIQWLDRQQSRMALMSHIELGQGDSSGNRSLATAFIDSWMLALESVGSFMADVATRQIAARIVGWNWGESEPVPRIAISGIGARKDVTAESLQLLLSSGALTPDPGLESWIRREYRLPEREAMALPAPSVAGDTVAAANRKTQPRAAKTKEPHPGQLSLPLNAADGNPFEGLQTDWEQARQNLLDQWPDASTDLIDELAGKAADAVAAGRNGDLGDLAVSAAVVTAVAVLLAAAMTGVAGTAASAAVAELAAAGLETVAPDSPGGDRIGPLSEAHAGQLTGGYAAAAGRRALTMAGPAPDRQAVEDAVRAHLADMSAAGNGLAGDTFGAALSAAQTVARREVFATFPDAQYVAVENNDDRNRCKPCSLVDGHVFPNLADADATYAAGGYSACLGGSRCRGTYTIRT